MTQDEWTEKYAQRLCEDLHVHIIVLAPMLTEEYQQKLLRLCMTSIRNWAEEFKE